LFILKFRWYKLIGKIVGKAIYENILIEPVLSRVFLNRILGKKNTIDELSFIDSDLYKNLMKLKREKVRRKKKKILLNE
jgi:hypothetical protein